MSRISRSKWAKNSLLITLLTALKIACAQAGTGWYVTIQNQSASDLNISFAGNDNWYCNDFCGPSTLKPNEVRTFYTEEKERSTNNAGIQGISMNDTHVEFYQGGHTHTGTEITSTPIYRWYLQLHMCDVRTEGGISSSDPDALSVTHIESGNPTDCQGFFGTVHATLVYKGSQSPH